MTRLWTRNSWTQCQDSPLIVYTDQLLSHSLILVLNCPRDLSPGLCTGTFCQLFTPGTTPKHLWLYHICLPFYALKHQLGVHDNISDTWNEKAFPKGHLYFRATGCSQNYYVVCPSFHSKQALSRADSSLYIMLGIPTVFYLSTNIWPKNDTIQCWSPHLGFCSIKN